MLYKITFHPAAGKEYQQAYQWYEERLEGSGKRFEDAVDAKLFEISSKPLLYYKKKGTYREARTDTFPYMIVYKVFEKEKTVFISAIYHTGRNPRKKYRK